MMLYRGRCRRTRFASSMSASSSLSVTTYSRSRICRTRAAVLGARGRAGREDGGTRGRGGGGPPPGWPPRGGSWGVPLGERPDRGAQLGRLLEVEPPRGLAHPPL